MHCWVKLPVEIQTRGDDGTLVVLSICSPSLITGADGAERMRREGLRPKTGVYRFGWVGSKGHIHVLYVCAHPCTWSPVEWKSEPESWGELVCQVRFWPVVSTAASPFFASWFSFLCWWFPLFINASEETCKTMQSLEVPLAVIN